MQVGCIYVCLTASFWCWGYWKKKW